MCCIHADDAIACVQAEAAGAPLASVAEGADGADGAAAQWRPLFEKIEQAARATRTKNVLAATAMPFGKRNAETMTMAETATHATAPSSSPTATASCASSPSSSPPSSSTSTGTGTAINAASVAEEPYYVYPRTVCGDCTTMREALAAVEHTTVELGLVDTSNIGAPG